MRAMASLESEELEWRPHLKPRALKSFLFRRGRWGKPCLLLWKTVRKLLSVRGLSVPPGRKRDLTPVPLMGMESEFMLLTFYRNFRIKKRHYKLYLGHRWMKELRKCGIYCYGLNCVPQYLFIEALRDGIWRWAFWEMIRFRCDQGSEALMVELVPL